MRMSQQLRMVLSSIDEDNLSPDIADRVMTDTKAEEERGSGQLAVTEYGGESTVGMSSTAFSHTTEINVVGSGYAYISGSATTTGGSWGTHRVEITKNGVREAYSTELFRQDQSGEFGTNASAMVKVQNGDVIRINYLISRSYSGNMGKLYNNCLAIGCVLEGEDLLERG